MGAQQTHSLVSTLKKYYPDSSAMVTYYSVCVQTLGFEPDPNFHKSWYKCYETGG